MSLALFPDESRIWLNIIAAFAGIISHIADKASPSDDGRACAAANFALPPDRRDCRPRRVLVADDSTRHSRWLVTRLYREHGQWSCRVQCGGLFILPCGARPRRSHEA